MKEAWQVDRKRQRESVGLCVGGEVYNDRQLPVVGRRLHRPPICANHTSVKPNLWSVKLITKKSSEQMSSLLTYKSCVPSLFVINFPSIVSQLVFSTIPFTTQHWNQLGKLNYRKRKYSLKNTVDLSGKITFYKSNCVGKIWIFNILTFTVCWDCSTCT